ncbi:MAG: flagellar hook-length control protein FliK [Hoeflea sp.]|uniref:flagellar hook-length control protein FliK n=1 Tax=Hoeflea sp. TaxID=1940281 RepID=UPI0032970044
MSALDIVLQRQVPVRSPVRTEADATGADAADDAFSSVLSGQKRSVPAKTDSLEHKDDPDRSPDVAADAEVDGPDAVTPAPTAQSDEILSLLAGLMSSTAAAGEAETAADGEAETAADGEEPAQLQTLVSNQAVEADATADNVLSVAPGAVQLPKQAPATEPADVTETGQPEDGVAQAKQEPVRNDEHPRPEEHSTQPEPAKTGTRADATAASAAVTPVVASQAAQTSGPVVAAQLGGNGRMGQGAQAPAKPQPAATAAKGEKVSSEAREAIRSLGIADESSAGSGSKNQGVDDRLADGAQRKSAGAVRSAEDSVNPKIANVEVSESRRFMPSQSLTGNAQMLTRSLIEAGDAALAAQRTAPAQAAAAAQPQTGQMLHTLKLQLNPLSLGNVTAVLKLSGEELSVSIKVETAAAYRQLSDDNQSILKAMRAQGFAVEQITIQHVASADRPANQAQQQGFQGNFQGSSSGDAQSSGRGNNGDGAGRQGSNQHGGQGREQTPYSGSGRTDGVYL